MILRELEAKGYRGEITLVRDYIRPKRALRKSRATVRFETAPGAQLQNDWAEVWTQIAGATQKVYCPVSTLGYSRWFHFWATDRMDAEHTYERIIQAVEHVGGVTREVLVDDQKALVIAHRIGAQVRFHERLLDLAGHYGFCPRACRPGPGSRTGSNDSCSSSWPPGSSSSTRWATSP